MSVLLRLLPLYLGVAQFDRARRLGRRGRRFEPCLPDQEKQFSLHYLDMKSALDHHYASNRHHPEHFVNGINDMTLVDIIEMLCDWKASTLRHNDGNLLKSIETNAERFNMDGQLKQILLNTARMIDEQED